MRRKFVMVLLATALLGTGCGSKMTITDEQSELLAESAADLILKNDSAYQHKLIEVAATTAPEEPNATNQSVSTPKPAASNSPAQTSKPEEIKTEGLSEVTLASLLGVKGLSCSYQGITYASSYGSQGTAYTLSAAEGNQFAVATFRLKNTTKKTQSLNFIDKKLTGTIKVGESEWYPSLITALENDIKFLNTTLAAGEEKEVVLIFEVKKTQKISKGSLYLISGTTAYETEIK